jgi:hypothetical protein
MSEKTSHASVPLMRGEDALGWSVDPLELLRDPAYSLQLTQQRINTSKEKNHSLKTVQHFVITPPLYNLILRSVNCTGIIHLTDRQVFGENVSPFCRLGRVSRVSHFYKWVFIMSQRVSCKRSRRCHNFCVYLLPTHEKFCVHCSHGLVTIAFTKIDKKV